MKVKSVYKGLKKILVFNPSFIGDAILTTPLVTALQRLLPTAAVSLCVRPESAPLFKGLGFDVMEFDKRKTDGGLAGMVRFSASLKDEGFDAVISAHKSLRTSLILRMSQIALRIGFAQAVGRALYTNVIARDMALHEVERNLSLLSIITDNYSLEAVKRLGGALRTYKDGNFADIARNYMRTVAEGKKIVGINAGSVWNTKRWATEYYAETAKKLYAAGYAVALLGGPQDAIVNGKLKERLDFEYFDFDGKTSFRDYPALISVLDLLITNDSAPLHVAVSQNVPVVAVFGPTVPAQGFAPYNSRSEICEIHGLQCRPCGLHGGSRCPKKHFKCMLDLPPEQVFAAAQKILSI